MNNSKVTIAVSTIIGPSHNVAALSAIGVRKASEGDSSDRLLPERSPSADSFRAAYTRSHPAAKAKTSPIAAIPTKKRAGSQISRFIRALRILFGGSRRFGLAVHRAGFGTQGLCRLARSTPNSCGIPQMSISRPSRSAQPECILHETVCKLPRPLYFQRGRNDCRPAVDLHSLQSGSHNAN